MKSADIKPDEWYAYTTRRREYGPPILAQRIKVIAVGKYRWSRFSQRYVADDTGELMILTIGFRATWKGDTVEVPEDYTYEEYLSPNGRDVLVTQVTPASIKGPWDAWKVQYDADKAAYDERVREKQRDREAKEKRAVRIKTRFDAAGFPYVGVSTYDQTLSMPKDLDAWEKLVELLEGTKG